MSSPRKTVKLKVRPIVSKPLKVVIGVIGRLRVSEGDRLSENYAKALPQVGSEGSSLLSTTAGKKVV